MVTPLTTEDVLKRFHTRVEDAGKDCSPEVAAIRTAYLKAAAVLHVFDPGKLLPFGLKPQPGGAAAYMIDDIVPALGWADTPMRTLRPEARKEAVGLLRGRADFARVLDGAVEHPLTEVQGLFEEWVRTGAIRLDQLSSQALSAVLTLADWGLSGLDGFPDRKTINTMARRRLLVRDFEGLASGFVGRQRELDVLREFIGFQPGSLLKRALKRAGFDRPEPLIVHGVGGAGKTALVARFVMEYFEQRSSSQFPFAYLAFDDRALDPADPVTIVSAALHQIENQLGLFDEARDLRLASSPALSFALSIAMSLRALLSGFQHLRDRLGSRANTSISVSRRSGEAADYDDSVFRTFGQLLEAIARVGVGPDEPPLPFLFVLDTFEEVEYLPTDRLGRFWRLVDILLETAPNLKLLIVGRARPISARVMEYRPNFLSIGDLSAEDAAALLSRLGVRADQARQVIRQVGCNPLTLRLAARVLLESGAKGITGVRTRRMGLVPLGEEIIRGQLYRRILDHIHEPEVAALAHPGMVLRRVTPELIQEVLVPALGLPAVNYGRAVELEAKLAREHTLVQRDGTGALAYRTELRRPMLRALTADRPDQVRELHQRAVRFYSRFEDDLSRAEEIYHALMLPHPPFGYLEERASLNVAQRLMEALEELPEAHRAWLASITGQALTGRDRRHASDAEEDTFIGREVLHLFRDGDFTRAYRLLSRRKLAAESPLRALRARALMERGSPQEALHDLTDALVHYPAFGSRSNKAELLWLASQATPEPTEALEWLQLSLAVVEALPSRLSEIQILTEMIGLLKITEARPLTDRLARLLVELDPAEIDQERALIRLALVRLGPAYRAPWAVSASLLVEDLVFELSRRDESEREALRQALSDKLAGIDPGSRLAPLASRLAAKSMNQRWLDEATWLLVSVLGAQTSFDAEASSVADSGQDVALYCLFEIFKAEKTTLAGATLAGLPRDRFYGDGPSFASA